MKVLKISGIVAALVAGFFAPDLIQKFSSASEVKPLDDYCLLSTTACVQQGVSMTLNVDTAQPLIPAHLEVSWQGNQAEQLVLSLAGREMDMGEPKFVLKKVAAGQYSGEITLPVCMHDAMTWVGELTDGQSTIYPAIKMQR